MSADEQPSKPRTPRNIHRTWAHRRRPSLSRPLSVYPQLNPTIIPRRHSRRARRPAIPPGRSHKRSRDYLAAARAADVGVGILGGQVDAGSLTGAGMPGANLIQRELLGDGSEEFADVLGRLCRGLEEEKAGLPCVGLGVGRGNGPLVGLLVDQVQLVAGERDDDVFVGLTLKFLDPCLCLVQRCL